MKPEDRLEFSALREEQLRLRRSVDALDARLDRFGAHLEREDVPAPAPKVAAPPPLPPPATPPEPRPAPAPIFEQPAPAERPPTLSPPPVPRVSDAAPDEPLELRVGTFWMARVGIVILLTGLVFLGNYAYQHLVPLLGVWGKLGLLALAGTALTVLGAWLERSREALANYGRVLMAGGAATLYYTVYAAHFVERLRVIESPVIGGLLLLAMAAGLIFYADKKRSEALAIPALLLAYYTSSINPIGAFTLFSNLLLTAAAVFFLVRHRWTRLSQASLIATYGSYAFWRFHQFAQTGSGNEFGSGIIFLAGYWILFTAAVFLAAPAVLRGPQRLAFLTVNNGAFFAFGAHHFAVHRPDAFWIFATGFGAVLLGLAALAFRLRSEERALDGAYLAQGLTLVTLGLAAKLTGPQLAVLLAVESAVLLVSSRARHRLLCEIAAVLCALGASGLAFDRIVQHAAEPLALGGSVAALLFADAWLLKRREEHARAFSERGVAFALLGLVVAGAAIWQATPAAWQPAAFAAAAVFSLGALRLRLPEIAIPGQAYLGLALAVFLARHPEIAAQPWWAPLPLVVIALGLMHWWQWQKVVALADELRGVAQLACAGVAVAAAIPWLRAYFQGDAWLIATCAAAFGSLLYASFSGAWALAAIGQIFTLLATASCAGALALGQPSWFAALIPVANLAATALLVSRFAATRFAILAERAQLFVLLAQVYRLAALALLAGWAFEFVDPPWRVAFFAGGGAALILLGGATRNSERALAGAVYAVVGLAVFWLHIGPRVAVQDLLAILLVPASLRLGRRLAGDWPLLPGARDAVVAATVASVWLWVTRWTTGHGDAGQLTAVWGVLALIIFAAGLALRERVYRLGGFAILALAIGRLFFFDVWRFDTLYRIVSFLVLGAVLLVLSFVYHRFAETLRRWL